MGWRDTEKAIHRENVEYVENVNQRPALIPLIPVIPCENEIGNLSDGWLVDGVPATVAEVRQIEKALDGKYGKRVANDFAKL